MDCKKKKKKSTFKSYSIVISDNSPSLKHGNIFSLADGSDVANEDQAAVIQCITEWKAITSPDRETLSCCCPSWSLGSTLLLAQRYDISERIEVHHIKRGNVHMVHFLFFVSSLVSPPQYVQSLCHLNIDFIHKSKS